MNTNNNNNNISSSLKKRFPKKSTNKFYAATSYRSDCPSDDRKLLTKEEKDVLRADIAKRVAQLSVPRPISPELNEIEKRAKKFEQETKERQERFSSGDFSFLHFTRPCNNVVSPPSETSGTSETLGTTETSETVFGVCHNSKCTYAHSLEQLRLPECKFGRWCNRLYGCTIYQDGHKRFDSNLKCSFLHPDETTQMYYDRTGIKPPTLPPTNEHSYKPEEAKEEVKEKSSKAAFRPVVSKPIPSSVAPWSGFRNKVTELREEKDKPLESTEAPFEPAKALFELIPVKRETATEIVEPEPKSNPEKVKISISAPKDVSDRIVTIALELSMKLGIPVNFEVSE